MRGHYGYFAAYILATAAGAGSYATARWCDARLTYPTFEPGIHITLIRLPASRHSTPIISLQPAKSLYIDLAADSQSAATALL